MQKLAFIVRNEKTVPNLKLTKKNSKKKKKKVFGHLIRTLNIGTFAIQIGTIEVIFFH